MQARSLITGQDRMITVKLVSTQSGRLSVTNIYSILRRFWPANLIESVRSMRAMKSGDGACFDIYEDQIARFMDNWTHLQTAEAGRLDFDVSRCTELPELDEDAGPMSAKTRKRKAKGKGAGKTAGSKSGNQASILFAD